MKTKVASMERPWALNFHMSSERIIVEAIKVAPGASLPKFTRSKKTE